MKRGWEGTSDSREAEKHLQGDGAPLRKAKRSPNTPPNSGAIFSGPGDELSVDLGFLGLPDTAEHLTTSLPGTWAREAEICPSEQQLQAGPASRWVPLVTKLSPTSLRVSGNETAS